MAELNVLTSVAQEVAFPEGYLLLVNKPLDWTSFDVVKKLRGALSRYQQVKKLKVGHAGTLDPLATGLLIIAVGKYTKELHHLQDLGKHYEGTIKFGARTNTYDAEGDEEVVADASHLTQETVQDATCAFTGPIMQVPPIFSAIKINGQTAYSIARRGRHVEMKPRPVTVHEFQITGERCPEFDFHVHCSKGTYIRSLAHDLGVELQVGGYLARLIRTSIGDYSLDDAWELQDLVQQLNQVIQSRG